MLTSVAFRSNGQSPGGVVPAAWYRADAPGLYSDAGSTPVANQGSVYQWNSQVGSHPLLQASSARRPVYSHTNLANFNPTVTFDGSNDFLETAIASGNEIIDRSTGTIYAAGYKDRLKRSGFAGFHPTMDYPGLHVFSNYRLLFFTAGGPGYQGISTDVMAAQRSFTTGAGWLNGGGSSASYASATVSLDGVRANHGANTINSVNLTNNARNFRIGGDSNYGAFSGQLNEVLVFGSKLTEEQMDRVESYLAIKYGTTYAKGARDYKNAAGGTVWDATVHAGFHTNIAGIARDDNGALYQKQSWSTNPGQQVLIGVGTLAGSNAENGGALTDGQYLIWGDNGLAKLPVAATSLLPGLSHHFPAIWRAQNTNGVGTVRVAWPKGLKSLSLVQSADAVIDGGDVVTDMTANEVTLGGVIYNYADVTLADGQYFTFAAKVPAPGGVTAGLTQWYRADEGVTSAGGDGTNVNTWTDFARGTVSAQISTAPVPVYREGATNYFNFNPGVNFTAIQQMLGNITTQTLESTNFDIFTLTKEKMTGGARFFNIGMNNTRFWGDNWDHPGLNYNGTVGTRNSGGGGAGVANPGNIAFSTTIPSIMYHTFTNTSIRKGLNGAALGTAWNISARGQMLGDHIFGSNRGPNPPRGDDWGFTGHIGEVIIYGAGNLTATERNRVDSYLALKYGITLPAGVNYLDSNGEIVWDAAANSAYHNNVAGIVNDDASAINQKQSISVNAGQQVIIGTTGLANTNAANATALSDGQFLIWGDNGLDKSLSTPFVFPSVPDLNLRFGAIWKVQNTGSSGTVRVAWPAGIPGIHLIQSTDETIDDTDTRTDMSANTIVINSVPYNYADVVLNDGQYFTFAGYLVGPGGVGGSVVWLQANSGTNTSTDGADVSSWANMGASGGIAGQLLSFNYPKFKNAVHNFNPAIVDETTNAHGSLVLTNVFPANAHRPLATFVLQSHPDVSSERTIVTYGTTPNSSGALEAPWFLTSTTKLPRLFWQDNYVQTAPITAITRINNIPATSSYYMPQWVSNPHVSTLSLNGATGTISGNASSNRPIGSHLYINSDGGSNNLSGGITSEIISYDRDLTETEIQQINTYLAIKYGITLMGSDGLAAADYLNSTAVKVWDTAINTGYNHNIAGIARDDLGSLYQKQSRSVNSGSQVLVSTTGLANTNTANTAVLANNQYLVWGDNGLAKAPVVSFGTIGGLPYYRFAAVWKVQNTEEVGSVRVAWRKGYANLKLIQNSSDATFAGGNTVTDMEGTQVVNGVEYAYADVTLTDGQYFTFAAFIQAPGGVTNGLSHWYRADKLTVSDGNATDVTAWTDFTSGVTSGQLNEAVALPKFKEGEATHFNFNPGVNFTANAQMLGNIEVQTLTSLDFDIFTLTKEGMSGGRFFNIGMNNTTFNGNNWDHPGLMTNGTIGRRNNTGGSSIGYVNPGSITFAANQPSIMYHKFTDTDMRKGLNGATTGAAYTHAARGLVTGGHLFGANNNTGSNPPNGDDGGFTGHIGELIIYGNGTISVAERNKVDSYLAIKYGVTLNNTSNYTTSQDVVVWDATENSGFYNNVAGIGYDFMSALEQKQSRSQHANSNNQVIIGLGDIAETNAENTGSLSDGQFLIWGDNGNTQAMTNAGGSYTAFEYAGDLANGRRMNRIWKVRNTNNVTGEVLIRFPKASVSGNGLPSFGANESCAAYVMIFADDAGFTTNVSYQEVTLTEDELNYDVSHTFPAGASYFTYGKVIPFNQGTVYLPGETEVSDEYITDCAVGEWRYFNKAGDAEQKLIGFSGFSAGELNNLEVTITPEGTIYEDDTRTTGLMARITTVADDGASYTGTRKVRVYYNQDELDAATVSGEQVSGWFKYEGDADEVVVDIFSDGLFDPAKAVALVPDAEGVEDGVSYVEFHNITSFSSFVYLSTTESSPLPVSLVSFSGTREGQTTLLSWITAGELQNHGFEVERSADARNWSTLGFVEAAGTGGNSAGQLSYLFTDGSPLSGRNYYRLKQLDLDGSSALSHVVIVNFDAKSGLMVYPNPVVGGVLRLDLTGSFRDEVRVFNMTGIEVLQSTAAKGKTVDVRSLPAGQYVLQVVTEAGERINKVIIIP